MNNDKVYVSVSEMAKRWNISDRTVRNYAKDGKIPGAYLVGRSWNIPSDSVKPLTGKRDLLSVLMTEMKEDYRGGIYHRIQIDLAYNSNHMEGSRLTHDQTRYIYETRILDVNGVEPIRVDDIAETINHFSCVKYILENVGRKLNESRIKELHRILKSSTSDSMKSWFAVGDYKRLPNEVGGRDTTSPEDVAEEMRELIALYEGKKEKTLEDIISFHVAFEHIHPFQDGNGRVGRLIMFKECLRNGIVPFIIGDDMKASYYRGLSELGHVNGYLMDTCLYAQDRMKDIMDYFRIEHP